MRYTPLIVLLCGLPLRADDLGLKVPPNFKVTLWADHTLANDIYTMCLDDKGKVVVSGPGYIRRLEDTNGDGKADKATDIAETKTGAMGLCFYQYPSDYLRVASSSDFQIRDRIVGATDKNDEHEKVALGNWSFGEHGGHALRFGPDGALYAIGGNNTITAQLKQGRESSVPLIQAGFLLRFRGFPTSDPECIAHGFRNPYDFDFTPYGDIITYDSDSERDAGLPWYTPTRVYHLMPGVHHGWRLPGGMRSLAKRDYYPDTVPMLADMGRGSPTGVCCYRHYQFPEHYRGGVFLLDWTFGRIYYKPLIPEGSSYKPVKPEMFLEATGSNGFAPTAARVAPDGSLFISIGGRGTRGAVYRVEYQIDGKPVPPRPEPKYDIDKILDAPQPLEAWSMAKWMPLVSTLKTSELSEIILNERESDERRIRALAIWNTRPGVFAKHIAETIQRGGSDLLRAAAARELRNDRGETAPIVLWIFATDKSPRVRVEALLALTEMVIAGKKTANDHQILIDNLGHSDHRVQLAAARLFASLPDREQKSIENKVRDSDSGRALVGLIVAMNWPGRPNPLCRGELIQHAMTALEFAKTSEDRIDAMRSVMISLGDWKISSPKLELHGAYSLDLRPSDSAFVGLVSHGLIADLSNHFPSKNERENIEASRLFAMLEVDDPALIRKIAAQITETSHPTRDFHYLAVLARMGALRDETHAAVIAEALLRLPKKLSDQKIRVESNWSPRFGELVSELIRVQPKLDELLAVHPDLVQPGNVAVVSKLKGVHRREAAKRLLAVVRENAEFPMSTELVDLIAELPDALPVLRARWRDRSIREAIVKRLAIKPEEKDRSKFLEMLESARADTATLCLEAMEKLPREGSAKNLVPVFVRLRQSFSEPKEAALRKKLLALIHRESAHEFLVIESKTDAAALATAYRSVFAWFERDHPNEAKLLTTNAEDEEAIRKLLPSVKWDAGDVERGRKLFNDRGCQACHGGNARLGPDLAGVGKRLSRDDLLTSIVNPSRDVSHAYRVTHVDTKDGKRVSGVIVYDSNEMLLVQTAATETKRISGADVEARVPSAKSLMPDGLFKGLKPEELADLFAYLAKQ